ncbi:MAG: hypothetical protein JEZ10_04125 [Verrucomicrobia bacterium]|nr:hypothetical protein [Verrucomicrobiota bacterium]
MLILCGLIGILRFLPRQSEPVWQGRATKAPLPTGVPFAAPDLHTERTPDALWLPGSREPLPEKLIRKTGSKLLADKEGSYTNLTDVFRGNTAPSVELRSDWIAPYLFPGRPLPGLRMRVIKNPETGDYQLSGGALALPRTGLEAGYETELNSEEYKATLHWKKSF